MAERDRGQLLELLERARDARINLPTGAPALSQASELRLPVPDRPGVIAEVSTLLGGLGVNIFDVEIAHSAEGDRGVLVLIVDASAEDVARKALAAAGLQGIGPKAGAMNCRAGPRRSHEPKEQLVSSAGRRPPSTATGRELFGGAGRR